MSLGALDWVLLAAYLCFNLGAALWLRSRSGEGMSEFFAAGRSAPWWLAGTSMAATTFAPDSPLGLTGLVAEGGISGYWWNWSFVLSTAATVALFSRYWRRSGSLTDLEFIELRYSGRPAAFLRGFRAVYLAIPINCLMMGWVNLAMLKILKMALGIGETRAAFLLAALLALTVVVAGLGGLRGVFVTDLAQFAIMMGLSITLAVIAVQHVGGMAELKRQLLALEGGGERLRMLPDPASTQVPYSAFLVYVGLNWWASWKPSAGSDGSGYIAQRLLSSRNERQAWAASLWFAIAQYVIRPWPWMLVALVSLVAYPGLSDPEDGYVRVMVDTLPPAFGGLMLAGFAASYMSTISTHLNWGASYLVHDGYRRYWAPEASQEQLVRVSRWTTAGLALLSLGAAASLESISAAWKLLVVAGAGAGAVLIARWFWWRVNAWSEIAAMTAAAVISLALQLGGGLRTGDPSDFVTLMLITTPLTTVIWVAVTLLTSPENVETLTRFYLRVRPHPMFWGPVARKASASARPESWGSDILGWLAVCGLIYGLLFGAGKVLLLEPLPGAVLLGVALTCAAFLAQTFHPRE